MTTLTTPRPRCRAALAALLAFLILAPAASATPGTFVDPGGSGASVTIDDTVVAPGQRLGISGTGFVSSTPAPGFPLIAIKPYDIDIVGFVAGGPDAYPRTDDALIWFVAQQPGGVWTGYIDLPPNLPLEGYGVGADRGLHWLRILSGAFSTNEAVTPPITYKVPFSVVSRLTLGLTNPAGAFQPGTTFRPGSSPGGPVPVQVTPQGRDFDPSEAVTVKLDGVPLATSITTDAAGDFPASARVPIPVATLPGPHTLEFSTSTITASSPITITAPPTATLDTPAVRPGGRFAFHFGGFIGVGGSGQKVAVVVNEVVLACLQADVTGSATGTAILPASTAIGTTPVGFAAGTSCGGPTSPVNDLPGSRVAPPLSVSATAPSASADASAVVGSALGVSGEGFEAGAPVAVKLDGVALASSLSVGADGRFAGQLSLPASTSPGERTLLFTAGSTSAVTVFTATSPPPPPPPPPAVVPAPPPPPAVPPPPPPVAPPVSPRVASAKVVTKGKELRLTLSTGTATRATATVKTAKKVRIGGKGSRARIVTMTRSRTFALVPGRAAATVKLTLTADGRKALRKLRSVKVIVRLAPSRGAATTKTLTIKRA